MAAPAVGSASRVRQARLSPWLLAPLLLSLTGCLGGCSPTYVLRAGYEEAKILWRRQPIERLLKDPQLDAATREKLELALDARAFAVDTLHLRAGDSYASYARVDENQVVYVVVAAYRQRLEPYTWWFPIVGRVPYKGYFSKSAADAEGACLEQEGYDTYVRPSVAFSTLGWFADPLLSSVLRYDRATLTNVIIHELLHNTSYLAGQTEFDESFANFVGSRGAIAFFAARDDTAARARSEAVWHDALVFSDFLSGFIERLRGAYAKGVSLDERKQLFEAGQAELRRLDLRTNMYRDFDTEALNNAIILHYRVYNDRLRLFDDLYHQEGDDLAKTIRVVLDVVTKGPDDPFAALRAQLRPAPSSAKNDLTTETRSNGVRDSAGRGGYPLSVPAC